MKQFIWISLMLIGCSSPKKPAVLEEVSLGVAWEESYPQKLSEWDFFAEPMNQLLPKEGVFPYDINSALFSDYAHKARFLKLPKGTQMSYNPDEVFDFPIGSVLIKNFYYPADFRKPDEKKRILETRLLIRLVEEWAWDAIVYQWNAEQTEATRVVLGKEIPIEWTDNQGALQRISYSIPSQPQCKSCHDASGKMTPIGPSARQMNRDNQLEDWHSSGLLAELPLGNIPKLVNYANETVSLNDRARAWLEINCAHCHRKEGPAKNSGLYLLTSQTDPYRLGVNKPPIAAGKGSGGMKYSIVPGNPDQSILVHRIASLEPGEMMPELGRKMQHQEGIALIRTWIAEMKD
jgi:uncharacterized repeat protein (TIGR03806 family)